LRKNNWQTPHWTLWATTSTLRGLLFTCFNGRITQLLEDVPLAMWQTKWFMHNGVPAHFTQDTKQSLDSHYPDWRRGQNGPGLWPLRLPNFTPAYFYLWGHLKDTVYSTTVSMQDELWYLIQVAVTIQHMPGIFQHTRNSWCQRAQLCIQTNGEHFQQLL
jgi:hypothetical protein